MDLLGPRFRAARSKFPHAGVRALTGEWLWSCGGCPGCLLELHPISIMQLISASPPGPGCPRLCLSSLALASLALGTVTSNTVMSTYLWNGGMNEIAWGAARGSPGWCFRRLLSHSHLCMEFIPVLTPYDDCSQDRWLSKLNANQDHLGHLVWGPIPQLLIWDLWGVSPKSLMFKRLQNVSDHLPWECMSGTVDADLPHALVVPVLKRSFPFQEKAPFLLPKFPIRWKFKEPVSSSWSVLGTKEQ